MAANQNEIDSAWKGQGKTGGKPQSEDTQIRGGQRAQDTPKSDVDKTPDRESRFSEEHNPDARAEGPDQEGLDTDQDVDNTRTSDMGSIGLSNKEMDNKDHGSQHKEGVQSNADQNSAARREDQATTTGSTPGTSGQTGGHMGTQTGDKKDRSTQNGL